MLAVGEVSARIMIGASAGFTFRYVGLVGRLEGSCPLAALMADCTSRAAPLMSRDRSNCRATLVEPRKLVEVISFTAAMRENCRSSGVATAEAMVSGLAPGSPAETLTVGKSTWGRGATGSSRKPMTPAMTSASVSRVVPTGRRMNGPERFTAARAGRARRRAPRGGAPPATRGGRRPGR